MEIGELQTLLNTLIECNVSYYSDGKVTLCLNGARPAAAVEETSVEPAPRTKEQEDLEERISRLPDQYQQLFR